ncbi:MAG: hypothetical protein R2838_12075, partial [Caldilineaceae bacterium]
SSKETAMHMEGAADPDAESLHLTMWTSGGSVQDPASGAEVRVTGDTALARRGDGAWEEIDGFSGLFAPGGNLMAYTRAAENVVNRGTDVRTTPRGEIEITRYTFDIDGRQFAAHMRAQMTEQAVAGGLPAGVQMELPKVYAQMTGTGELWVGDDGLPLRQIFDLSFPPDAHDYVTTARMTVDFAGFGPAPVLSLGYRLEQDLTAVLRHVTAPVSLVTLAGTLLGMLFALGVVLYRRTRTVYRVISTAVIASMLSVTLMTNTQIRLYAGPSCLRERAGGAPGSPRTDRRPRSSCVRPASLAHRSAGGGRSASYTCRRCFDRPLLRPLLRERSRW